MKQCKQHSNWRCHFAGRDRVDAVVHSDAGDDHHRRRGVRIVLFGQLPGQFGRHGGIQNVGLQSGNAFFRLSPNEQPPLHKVSRKLKTWRQNISNDRSKFQ